MDYIFSNIASFLGMGCIFILAFLMERKNTVRIFTTLNISTSAIFCALSAILTNVVGYSNILGGQIMLGNFLIFLIGMMFGPMIGSVSAIVTDTIGTLLNTGGGYHLGFMFIKVIIGFAGGFVFFFKTNRFWKTKMLSIFIFSYLLSSILSPVFLYTLYGTSYTIVKFITKLIRAPFELFIYNSLIYLTFKMSYLFLTFHHQGRNRFWFMKNGTLKVHRKRSLREKYQIDLYGNHLNSRKESHAYYEQIIYNNINGVINYEN